jgi:dipeptidyl aminopeptidase/acylaminoacyl peptidase
MFRTVVGFGFALALGASPAFGQGAASFIDKVDIRSARIAPGGGEVAFIRRSEGAQQVLVLNLANQQLRQLQAAKESDKVDLDWVSWKGDGRVVIGATAEIVAKARPATGSHVLKAEDETYRISRVFSMTADGGNLVQMFQGKMSELAWGVGSTGMLDELPSQAGKVLIAAVDNSGVGAWSADVASGKVERVADGSWETSRYVTDGSGYPVMRFDETEDVERIFRRASGASDWIPAGEVRKWILKGSPDFIPVGPGPGANKVYVLVRTGEQAHAALHLYDASTGEFGAPLFTGAQGDAVQPWIHPGTRELIATCEFAARLACRTIDPKLQKYVNALDQFFDKKATGELIDMSADAKKWLLHVSAPEEGEGLYLFDVATAHMEPLVDAYPKLDKTSLSPTEVVNYAARDGTSLWAYVTAKPGSGRRPMVVMPHGGPEARDDYGFDAFAQFLAAQGYVVVQPNFRGSAGSGGAFTQAGRGQWGKLMQDDVSDAVKHMVDAGVADAKRVCIVGASYGGYAALAGVALTPELYRCAVSIAGVSDLGEMLKAERFENGRNSNVFNYWRYSIGDPDKDRDALQAVSPRRLAAKITAPVLLVHGQDDETVPIRQSEIMQDALKAAGHPARLVRVPKADHYWDHWKRDDVVKLYEETAAFLKQNLN